MLRRAMGKKKPEEMASSVLYLLKVQKRTESTPNWRENLRPGGEIRWLRI